MQISNKNIPENKPISNSLPKIAGIAQDSTKRILRTFNIGTRTRFTQLPHDKIKKIKEFFNESTNLYRTNLKNYTAEQIANKITTGTYQGIRILQGLPSRGQRTRSNKVNAKKTKIRIKRTK